MSMSMEKGGGGCLKTNLRNSVSTELVSIVRYMTSCSATEKIVALPTKNIKVTNSFYKGMHDMQRCLRL